jgi:DNA-binding NtrC family response regulator
MRKEIIREALAQLKGNLTQTAKALAFSLSALTEKDQGVQYQITAGMNRSTSCPGRVLAW